MPTFATPMTTKLQRAALMAMVLLATQAADAAKPPSLDAGYTMTADHVVSDFRRNTLELSGNVRVAQGPASIEAQAAKGRGEKAENSRWSFEKAVRIRTPEADLFSDLATAGIVNGQFADARIEGAPARFEQVAGTANRQIRGRAGVIEYDFNTGVVKLSNQVWFSNGKDEFRGDVVVYSIRDERVQINPGGSSNRVRGIIRPSNSAKTKNNAGASGSAAVVEPAFKDGSIEERQDEQRLATDGGGA
jgi:lipopolysaccharide transport protein LptA